MGYGMHPSNVPVTYPPGEGPGQETTYYGAEGHFFGGVGMTSVTCHDKCGKKQTFRYIKICGGGAIGAGFGGGLVTGMGGKDCKSSTYAGYFYEGGASFGPWSLGADVGYSDNGGTVPVPTDTSGVNEIGGGLGGFSMGAMFKSTWCYYIPLQPE